MEQKILLNSFVPNFVSQRILKVCAILLLAYTLPIDGQTKCRICNAARSLDDCIESTTCGVGEKCYMDEVVSETLAIEYYSGCRAKDVCSSASHPIGKRSLAKRGSFIACSRCCDSSPTSNGRECNTKLCGIKFIYQMSQCYLCDSTKTGGQGDVKDPTECGSYTTCQTDQVCGSQTFALGMNVTHRMTCLSRRICTLLTHRALEDIKRCKDKANVAAGLCGSRKRSGQMVCTACCGDAVCNGGTCDDILERLYNLWTLNALNFDTLKATGTNPSTATASSPSMLSNSSTLILSTKAASLPIVSITSSSSTSSSLTTSTPLSFGTPTLSASLALATPQKSTPTSKSVPPTSPSSSSINTTAFTMNGLSMPSGLQTTLIVRFTASPNSKTAISTTKTTGTRQKVANTQTTLLSTRLTGTRTKVQFTASPKQSSVISSVASASSVSNTTSVFYSTPSSNVLGLSKIGTPITAVIQTQRSHWTTVDSFRNKIRKPTGSEEIVPPTIVNLTPTSMYGNPPIVKTKVTSPSL